jgi:hypothetical protein
MMAQSPVCNAFKKKLKTWKLRTIMNSDSRVYLSVEEQVFLMEWLEINDPIQAVERFAVLMVKEKVDPTQLQDYLKKVMAKVEKMAKAKK